MKVRMDEVSQFFGPNGDSFVYLVWFPFDTGQLLYSEDGITYYEMTNLKPSGVAMEHALSFHNPNTGFDGEVIREYTELRYHDQVFLQRTPTFRGVGVVQAPRMRLPLYLYQLEDGSRLIYVSTDAYRPGDYRYFRLYTGEGPKLYEQTIKAVQFIPGTGQRIIETSLSILQVQPPEAYRAAKWGLLPLTLLNIEDYDLDEGHRATTVNRKVAWSV